MIPNTATTYGSVTKSFHWLTALLILTNIPLGIYANGLPFDTSEALAQKALIFSLHKTIGVTALFVAIARILWAISQPKPASLHPDRKVETFLAETVHWLLYASIILVPLSGWIHHAATTGFAPIWWPFGQSLPFVPKNDDLAHSFAALHIIFERVLIISFALHLLGALKHHFVDRDLTLKRMLPGTTDPEITPAPHRVSAPILAAGVVYAAALATGTALGLFAYEKGDVVTPQLATVETGWEVREGTLGLTVRQLGSDVTGSFQDWTAAINFSETPDADGKHGDVVVTISIPSLTLGSVTAQALGADFFAADTFSTATYSADIFADTQGYIARGTLMIKDREAPVNLPFSLTIDGDVATMTGQTKAQRLDYGIGQSYPDESSVGFEVVINVDLTAERVE